MKVTTKAPGTCGEFIQGIWRNQPCLISAPVSMYSTAVVQDGTGQIDLKPKAQRLLTNFFYRFNIPFSYLKEVDISIESQIPVGHGFGSSTADLGSLYMALSRFFYVIPKQSEITQMLAEIEPTDSSLLKNVSLINPYTGELLYTFFNYVRYKSPKGEILALTDPDVTIDTDTIGYVKEFNRDEKAFKKILDKFSFGLVKRDMKILAQACTESALLNQNFLYKPGLERIIELALENNGFGVIIGHTGNTVGIIKDPNTFNEDDFIQEVIKLDDYKNCDIRDLNLVPGGVLENVSDD